MADNPQKTPSLGSRSRTTCNSPDAKGIFITKCFSVYSIMHDPDIEIPDDVWESLFAQSCAVIGAH